MSCLCASLLQLPVSAPELGDLVVKKAFLYSTDLPYLKVGHLMRYVYKGMTTTLWRAFREKFDTVRGKRTGTFITLSIQNQ